MMLIYCSIAVNRAVNISLLCIFVPYNAISEERGLPLLKQETNARKTSRQESCSLLLPLKGICRLTTASAKNFKKVQQTYLNEYLPTAELARALASSTWGGPTVACWVVGRVVHHALILRARRAMRPRSRPSARKPGKHAPVHDPS